MSLHLPATLEIEALRLRIGRVCLGAFVIGAGAWALADGPHLRATAEERMAAAIAAEDQDSAPVSAPRRAPRGSPSARPSCTPSASVTRTAFSHRCRAGSDAG